MSSSIGINKVLAVEMEDIRLEIPKMIRLSSYPDCVDATHEICLLAVVDVRQYS